MKSLSLFLLLAALLPSPAAATDPDRLVIGAEAGKGVAIVDPSDDNRVLWHQKIGAVHDLHLLPNGNLLTQDGWPHVIEIEIGPREKTVWEYDAMKQNRDDGVKKVEVHAYQRLANGNTMIAESGASRIIEVDPDGKIVKQFPLKVGQSSAHSDTRLVRRLKNGNTLVAHENDQTVREYDQAGKVVWEFPVPLFGKKPAGGHGPEGFGGRCFSATKAKNGNYLIATGNGHSVLEVTPEKEIVWKLEQKDIKGVTLAWVTNVHELENGNLVIGNCHAGPENPQLIEVTRDKELVWSFKDFNVFGNALANTLVIDGEAARELRKRLANL